MNGHRPGLATQAWGSPLVAFMLALSAGMTTVALTAPPPREEEEAPLKSPPRKVLRIEEPTRSQPSPRDSVKPPTSDGAASTLLEEAREADQPEIRDLFHEVAYPYDQITKPKGGIWKVKPLPWPLGAKPDPSAELDILRYDDGWRLYKLPHVTGDQIAYIRPYEEFVLERVKHFLARRTEGEKQSPTRMQRLDAAEKVLSSTVSFHDAFKELGQRGGPKGEAAEKELRALLWSVQLEQFQSLCDAGQWPQAYAMGVDLSQAYAGQDDKLTQLSEQLGRLVREPLKQKDYAETSLRLRGLETLFRDSKAAEEIRQELRRQAMAKFSQAQDLRSKNLAGAQALLNEAAVIDPTLPGLHHEIVALTRAHPIAYVGVRRLPALENLSPATAHTDADRQAIELMFSSLVKRVEERVQDQAGEHRFQYYVPDLAAGEPQTIPLGRRFRLDRGARWSDGKPVTAADVRETWQALRQQGQATLLNRVEPGGDPFVIDAVLDQGYVDPLSLMTFKVLPAGTPSPESDDYRARFLDKDHLRGSGPFRFDGLQEGRAIFKANPYYRRGERTDLPHIQEIRFVHPRNAAAEFSRGELHLLLDLPTKRVHEIESVQGVRVLTMRNGRIYILAVNHRDRSLRGNAGQALRWVMANGIDREKILDDFFRDKEDPSLRQVHRALNGPYPPDSWASDPAIRPYNVKLAREHAQDATAALALKSFTLKYSREDDQAEAVCNAIRDQLAGLGVGIEIRPVPRSPEELRYDVEVMHDYQLAYYSYDYPSDAYELAPLFDPSEVKDKGGRNYLGYANDGELDQKFREAVQHRDFAQVRAATFEIHRQIHDKVPLIPLWQLDAHIAVHQDLTLSRLSPLTVFDDVENWRLDKR